MPRIAVLCTLLGLAMTAPAAAADRFVSRDGSDLEDCLDEANPCRTLPRAVDVAEPSDRVLLAEGTYAGNVVIDKSLTIEGRPTATISGLTRGTTLAFNNAGRVRLRSLRIYNGRAERGGGLLIYDSDVSLFDCLVERNAALGGSGAGIHVGSGSLELVRTTVSDNVCTAGTESMGGGIAALGEVTLVNSTISGNTANVGGGIILGDGPLVVLNSTISANTAAELAGGIHVVSSEAILRNSILAGNVAPEGPECSLTFLSAGHNLVGDTAGCTIMGDTATNILTLEPRLGVLADNGGRTPTHELLATSPAIDAGDPAGCTDALGGLLVSDQRGAIRPVDCGGGPRCDIGAFEACSEPGAMIWESTDPAELGTSIGTATTSPFEHTPPDEAALYYQAPPWSIRLTKGGPGLRVFF